mgnify:CR=1 FL=1
MGPFASDRPGSAFAEGAATMTTSAPSSSGRCRTGEAKVLSTTSRAPCPWAIAAAAAMSVRETVGLAGVSTKTIVVLGRMAARSASRSEVSTKLDSSPKRLKSRSITTRDGP